MQQCAVVHGLIRTSKASYYTDLISELKSKPSDLFGTLETLLKGRTEKLYPPCNSSEDLANLFADYFEWKISTIRADLHLRRPILQDPLQMRVLNTARFYSGSSHLSLRCSWRS